MLLCQEDVNGFLPLAKMCGPKLYLRNTHRNETGSRAGATQGRFDGIIMDRTKQRSYVLYMFLSLPDAFERIDVYIFHIGCMNW